MIFFDISILVKSRINTGIQRVLKEILRRFIVKDEISFCIISFDETQQVFKIIDKNSFLNFLVANNSKKYEFRFKNDVIDIFSFKKGDVFFDIDAYWNSRLKRSFLYPILKERGVKIYNVIHDLIPIKFPYFSEKNTLRNFIMNLAATYRYSDITFFPSRSTERDFYEIAEMLKIKVHGTTRIVKWGSEITHSTKSISIKSQYKKLLDSKYILFVGTLEPRKRQDLLLEVFEKLVEVFEDINLVFIGRPGWNNDKFIQKLSNHSLLNKKVFWLTNIDDNELVYFYENAYLNVYLSDYEGFGLPIIESLSYGNITITSKNSSMYEVGKNFADYIEYNSFNELYEILFLYLIDNNLYNLKKKYIQDYFYSYSWDQTYNAILNSLKSIDECTNLDLISNQLLQFVFISINYDNIKETIKLIDKYVNFVKEYIIVTNKNNLEKMKTIKSKHPIIVIDERMILKKLYPIFEKGDHVTKNWLLRMSLLNIDILDENFVMLDDDNRPLRKIDISNFIEDGKYKAYFFYDLLEWACYNTDYDIGQHNMKEVLDREGYELLSYSSHRPQIINKTILQQVKSKFFNEGLSKPIDEWSIYFNYAVSNYPYLFKKKKYDVLNWPQHPSNWKQKYFPDEYNFENYYKDNFSGSYKEKIDYRLKEEKPYRENILFEEKNFNLYKKYNLVHGVLEFNTRDIKVFIFNIPYFIELKSKSWYKKVINYKIIKKENKNIYLVYYINNKEGAKLRLPLFKEGFYEENIIEFGISAESLKEGVYDVLLDIEIDGEKVYGLSSPYLVKVIVK